MWYGRENLPPEMGGPDPTDPEYEHGVLIGLLMALLIGLPIWWLVW